MAIQCHIQSCIYSPLNTFDTRTLFFLFPCLFLEKFPQMASVTVTYRDGRVAQLENIYIRGSKIRFMILPDMLKNAPMFKNMMTRFDQNLRI